jgi:hypothetical protein
MSFGRNLAVGVFAGAVRTAAMDLFLYVRYRRDGGHEPLWQWEFADGVTSWDKASAPGQLGQRGIGWGLQYGVLDSRTPGHSGIRALALDPTAWLVSYAILPLAEVYKPIWEYDVRILGDDVSAHLVYGTATSAVFAALTREEP